MDDVTEFVEFLTALLTLAAVVADILSRADGSADREEDNEGR